MDIKEELKELRFTSNDVKKLKWFKGKHMVGITTKENRILITRKSKVANKEDKKGKFSIVYKGQIPDTKEDVIKLFTWLDMFKTETVNNDIRE